MAEDLKLEPLRGKINYGLLVYSDNSNFSSDRDKIIEQWQEFAKSVKSAAKFFQRYRDGGAFKLPKEQPETYAKWMEEFNDPIDKNTIWDYDAWEGYNHWLFNMSFQDVME